MRKNNQRPSKGESTLDLGEKEEEAACHASALALAMTDEAFR